MAKTLRLTPTQVVQPRIRLSAGHVKQLLEHEKKVAREYKKLVWEVHSSSPDAVSEHVFPMVELLVEWAALFAADNTARGKKPRRIVKRNVEQILAATMGFVLGTALLLELGPAAFVKMARPSYPWLIDYA